MAKVTKDIYKISWMTWDGKDILIIQSQAYNVDEEDVAATEEKTKTIKKLTHVSRRGSVKFTFGQVNTQAKVNKYVKDIEDGKLK